MMKKVLVIGGGGREHAIVDALSRSPQVGKIYCAPGNVGIATQAKCAEDGARDSSKSQRDALVQCIGIDVCDVLALREFALSHSIDLTVVGPEAALAAGIVDEFRASGLQIFGHTKAATRIESSKEFAKQLMIKYNIPTAAYQSFSDYEEAICYVRNNPLPCVLKYDGLAAGKGVVIAKTYDEADKALQDMLMHQTFGQGRVVIEDYLEGPEFSFMCFVNGADICPMILAQDHKRAYDGDCGPNTGGMGAYTVLPFITEEDYQYAYTEILQKTASAMMNEGCPLSGVLYGGLMKTKDGIKVIEFNARFGDPETEVVLPLLESDIYNLFTFDFSNAQWTKKCSMGVVMASKGYPGKYEKGYVIEGLDDVDAKIYHMGTRSGSDGKVLTDGGRVLMVVATGQNINEVRNKVYNEIGKIRCENLFYRSDIAYQAITN